MGLKGWIQHLGLWQMTARDLSCITHIIGFAFTEQIIGVNVT